MWLFNTPVLFYLYFEVASVCLSVCLQFVSLFMFVYLSVISICICQFVFRICFQSVTLSLPPLSLPPCSPYLPPPHLIHGAVHQRGVPVLRPNQTHVLLDRHLGMGLAGVSYLGQAPLLYLQLLLHQFFYLLEKRRGGVVWGVGEGRGVEGGVRGMRRGKGVVFFLC